MEKLGTEEPSQTMIGNCANRAEGPSVGCYRGERIPEDVTATLRRGTGNAKPMSRELETGNGS